MSAKAKTPRRKAAPTSSGQAKKAARAKVRPKQAKKAPRKPAKPRSRPVTGGPEERFRGEELSSADVRLQHLLKFNPAIIYSCHLSEEFLLKSISENVFSILGYTVEECLDDPEFFDERVHLDDIDRVLSELPSMVKKGHVVLEYRFLHKDGTYRWMHDESKLSYDAKGKPHELVGYWIDITERKRAEEALQESEQKFRSLVETTIDWVWEVDSNGVYTYASPKVKGILGYEPEELIGKTPFDIMPTDEAKKIASEFKEALKSRKPILRLENINLHKDGRRIFLETSGAPAFDKDGNVIGYRGMDRDITERKRAEEEISRQAAVLYAINKVFQDALTCDTEEELGKTCLAAAEKLTGSKFGFYGVVNPAGLMDDIAISNPGWDACEMAVSDARKHIKDMPIRGIDRSTIREGKSRIVNEDEMATHPDRVGAPEGHPPITAFLGVPLKHEGKTIGMIGLGNKEGGYDITDQEAVESLAVAIVEVLRNKRAEKEREKLLRDVEERYKELECVYGVAESIRKRETLDEIFMDAVALIPRGWQYPEITCARIAFEGREFTSKGFRETEWKQSSDIVVRGEKRGVVEVYYLEECPALDEGPFLEEERDLIDGIARTLAEVIERKRAEEELSSAKSRMEHLLGSSPAIIYSFEASGDFLLKSISENVFSILGYTAEECLADPGFFDKHVHPDDKERMELEFQDAAAKGHGASEYRFLHKNGTYRWLREEFKLVRDADGNPYEYVGYEIDITERKRAEEELISAKSRLEFLLGSSPAIIYTYETSGDYRLKSISENVFSILGYTAEECLADPAFSDDTYVHPDDKERLELEFEDAVAKGHGVSEYRFLHKDGTYRWIREEYKLVRDADGNPYEFVGYVIDITERKRAEEEMISAKSRLELLLGSSPAIIYSTEISGSFQLKFISENVFSILGYTVEECLADPEFAAYKYVHPDDKERLELEFQDAIAKGHGVGEYRFLHKDGTYRWIREEFKLIRDADGNPYEFIGYEIDITERKRAEEEVISAKSRLEYLLGSSPAIIYSSEASGDFLLKSVSENVFSILGYTVEECLADPEFEDAYVHPDDKERVDSDFEDAVEKGHGASEYRFLHKNGTYRWMREEFKLVRDADGNPYEFVGYWTDITQRRWAEEALVESEERFRSVFESSMIGMYRTTPKGRILMANPAFARMLGYASVEEIAQHNLEKDGHWAEYERSLFVKRLEKESQITGLETLWTRKDGTSLYVRESAVAVYDQAGHALYYEGTVEDITDRKRAEARLQDSEEKYHNLFRRSNHGIFIHDLDGNIIDVNQKALDQFGYSKSEMLALRIPDLHPPEALEAHRRASQKVSRDGHANFEINFEKKNGEIFPAEVTSGLFEVAGQKVVQDVVRDITRRKRAEEALRDSEASFRLLFADNPHPMWVYDLETLRFLEVNDAAVAHYGYSRDEFLRMRITDIRPPEDARRLLESMQEPRSPLRHGGHGKHRLKNSLLIDVEVVSHTLEFDGRKAALVVAQDVTERKQAEEQLVHNALHDSLTDLPNRMLLADRMEQMLARSKRRKDYSFAVLFLDLDRFKVVNDSLGHTVGDELLVGVARRLEKCLRAGDTVARVGGDEFAMLLDDIDGPSDATQAAERIQEELSPPLILSERQVFTTASIGIAFSTTGYDRSEDILRDADTAMYRAKELGRARYDIFDETMHTRAVDLFQLQTDLRRAVERSEFLIQYQPIVSLESGKVAGLEALLRWQHPQRGVIPPKEFIPIAEETGFINTIGLWVIQEAGRRLRAWQTQFPENASLFLSINISGKLFIQPDMVPQIGQILREIDLCPDNLRLEVTEGAVMENTEAATETLSQLKALSVRLHLDDFGTGYSSLSYLHRFQFDGLKIDQSFINHMSTTDGSLDIVRTIVTLARTLRMETIAEGVETEEQLAHLKAIKCQYAQGFLFSKPLDSSAVGPFLESDPQW